MCYTKQKKGKCSTQIILHSWIEEWKYIARWSNRIKDESLRKLVKTEAVLMVNTAFQLGYISTDKYKLFCTSNNYTLGSKSLGMDITVEGINPHHVP